MPIDLKMWPTAKRLPIHPVVEGQIFPNGEGVMYMKAHGLTYIRVRLIDDSGKETHVAIHVENGAIEDAAKLP